MWNEGFLISFSLHGKSMVKVFGQKIEKFLSKFFQKKIQNTIKLVFDLLTNLLDNLIFLKHLLEKRLKPTETSKKVIFLREKI